MIVARYTAQVFECDTPSCSVKRIGGDWSQVEGFHGTIREVNGSGGVDGGEWFACKADHVKPSIHAVLSRAWEGTGQ